MPFDVIVVGTRVAGASTAMLLARTGLRVLAVDRARFPSDTLSSHQVQVPGVARLARWGVMDALELALTPPTRRLRLNLDGVVLEGNFPDQDGVGVLLSPRRTVLDDALVQAARASGAQIRENYVVKDLVWEHGRVVGICGNDRGQPPVFERAPLVIGADGKHSLVAKATKARVRRSREPMTVASYAYFSGLPMQVAEVHHGTGHAAAAFATNEGLTVVYLATPITGFGSYRRDIEHSYLSALDTCGDLGARVRCAQRVAPIRTTNDLPHRILESSGPGWALVGDAGFVMDPVSAHGITQAFIGAELLADAIGGSWRSEKDLDARLRGYERARDAGSRAIFEFTTDTAALATSQRQTAWMNSLISRPARIDDLIGVFSGTVSSRTYFSPANAVRVLGPRTAARLALGRARQPGQRRRVGADSRPDLSRSA